MQLAVELFLLSRIALVIISFQSSLVFMVCIIEVLLIFIVVYFNRGTCGLNYLLLLELNWKNFELVHLISNCVNWLFIGIQSHIIRVQVILRILIQYLVLIERH